MLDTNDGIQMSLTWIVFKFLQWCPISLKYNMYFCPQVGFHIKNTFFINQIKFFQRLGGVILNEEGFPREGFVLELPN